MRTPCEHKWDPYIEENKIMLAKGTMISRSEISLRIINKIGTTWKGRPVTLPNLSECVQALKEAFTDMS